MSLPLSTVSSSPIPENRISPGSTVIASSSSQRESTLQEDPEPVATSDIAVAPGQIEGPDNAGVTQIHPQAIPVNNFLVSLENYPLSITLANAYIASKTKALPTYDLPAFLVEFNEKKHVLPTLLLRRYPISVAVTFALCIDEIAKEDPNAIKLLNYCIKVAQEDIPEEMLEKWLIYSDRTLYKYDFEKALRLLMKYSIVQRKRDSINDVRMNTITLNRDIYQAARDEHLLPEMDESTLMLGILSANNQFEYERGIETHHKALLEEHRARNQDTIIPHARTLFLSAMEQSLYYKPTGILATELGAHCWENGDIRNAMFYQQSALKIFKLDNAKSHSPEIARAHNFIGKIMIVQGDVDCAIENIKKGLEMKVAHYKGLDNRDISESYNDLGLAYLAKGDFVHAEPNLQRALAIRNKYFDGQLVADTYNNLGKLQIARNNPAQAHEYLNKALSFYKVFHKTEFHRVYGEVYNNLGMLHKLQGNPDQAVKYIVHALKIRLKCESRIDLAESYNNYGLILKDRDQFEIAKICHEKALQIYTNCFGEIHSSVALTFRYLGDIYFSLNNFDKARDFYLTAEHVHQLTDGDKYKTLYETKIKTCVRPND